MLQAILGKLWWDLLRKIDEICSKLRLCPFGKVEIGEKEREELLHWIIPIYLLLGWQWDGGNRRSIQVRTGVSKNHQKEATLEEGVILANDEEGIRVKEKIIGVKVEIALKGEGQNRKSLKAWWDYQQRFTLVLWGRPR